jgi:periplasmic divalent cation tolerance protein
MPQAVLVIVSCPPASAESIAQPLVEEGLAACVSIVASATSIYRWKGELCKDEESLLLIKTEESQWQALEKRIKELHSYEVPEILMLPITAGHAPYLLWLADTVRPANPLPQKG